MNQYPLILLTNDDGIASPGLRAAVQAVHDLGEIWVVAPRQQQSGMGRSLPDSDGIAEEAQLDIAGGRVRAFSLETSPAGAVLYALTALLPRLPDLAISGINYGENVGSGVTSSGTVGAALEAACAGVPSLAVSLETDTSYHFTHSLDIDFRVAAQWVRRLAQQVLTDSLPPGVDVLKVDVPSDATMDTPGRLTRVSRQRYFYPTRPVQARGLSIGPLGYEVRVDHDTLEPGSDIATMCVDRLVSVCPLTLDLTAHADTAVLSEWLGLDGHSR